MRVHSGGLWQRVRHIGLRGEGVLLLMLDPDVVKVRRTLSTGIQRPRLELQTNINLRKQSNRFRINSRSESRRSRHRQRQCERRSCTGGEVTPS